MSCLWCEGCGNIVDSDDDPECVFDTPTRLNVVMCEACREMSDIEHELNYLANESDFAAKDNL